MASYEELNLDKVLKTWSADLFQSTNESEELDLNNMDFNFDLTHVRFKDKPPTFQLRDPGLPPSPKSKIVCTRTFHNDTEEVQTYPIKHSSETVSTATVTMVRAMIYAKKTRLNLWELPEPVRTSGFGPELAVTGLQSQELSCSQPYSLDELVEVPANAKRKVNVVLTEKQQEYDFEVETKIKGKVHCNVLNSGNGEFVGTLDGDIVQILESYGTDGEGTLLNGLTVDGRKARFISQGRIGFKYHGEATWKETGL